MAKRVKGRRDGLWVDETTGQTRPWGDTWNRQGGRKTKKAPKKVGGGKSGKKSKPGSKSTSKDNP